MSSPLLQRLVQQLRKAGARDRCSFGRDHLCLYLVSSGDGERSAANADRYSVNVAFGQLEAIDDPGMNALLGWAPAGASSTFRSAVDGCARAGSPPKKIVPEYVQFIPARPLE